jgi:hypothetical protein
MKDTAKLTKEVQELRREIHQLRRDFRQHLSAKRIENERLAWAQTFAKVMERKKEAAPFQCEAVERPKPEAMSTFRELRDRKQGMVW